MDNPTQTDIASWLGVSLPMITSIKQGEKAFGFAKGVALSAKTGIDAITLMDKSKGLYPLLVDAWKIKTKGV